MGSEIEFRRAVIHPDEWVIPDNDPYVREHVDTGRIIHEETFYGKLDERRVLLLYLGNDVVKQAPAFQPGDES